MLANIGLTETEPICQDDCFTVLYEGFGNIASWRMQGHHERAVFQIVLLNSKKNMR